MTNDAQWGPLNGLMEHYQRSAVVGLHPGWHHRYSESHHGAAHRHWPCGEGTGWDDCGSWAWHGLMSLPLLRLFARTISMDLGLTEAQEILKGSA